MSFCFLVVCLCGLSLLLPRFALYNDNLEVLPDQLHTAPPVDFIPPTLRAAVAPYFPSCISILPGDIFHRTHSPFAAAFTLSVLVLLGIFYQRHRRARRKCVWGRLSVDNWPADHQFLRTYCRCTRSGHSCSERLRTFCLSKAEEQVINWLYYYVLSYILFYFLSPDSGVPSFGSAWDRNLRSVEVNKMRKLCSC